MSRKYWLSGFMSALAVGLAACGGSFTSSGDPLTEAEASDLAGALVEGGFAGFGSFASPSRAPGMAATRVTTTLNETAPCEGGGTVAISGSLTADVNQQGTGGTITFSYTAAPSGCKVTTSGGKTFTINGDPNLKVQGDFTFTSGTNSETFQGTLTYDGKFGWTSSDGRAGSCGVDLTANYNFSFSGTGSSGTATLTGTVCGVTVNRSISVSA